MALICLLATLAGGTGVAFALSVDSGESYWLVSSSGQVFAFGQARNYGSEAGKRFHGEITGIISTPNGKGYWLISSSGQKFGFGDAHLYKYKATKLQKLTGHVAVKNLRGRIVGVAIAKLPVAKVATVTTTTSTTAPTSTQPTTTTTSSGTTPTTTPTPGPGPGPTVGTPEPLEVMTSSLPVAADEVAYFASLKASGGTKPYTWAVDPSSSLPPGLFLTPYGAIVGTPTALGTYQFTVDIADAGHQTTTATFSITVAQGTENWSGYAEQDGADNSGGAPYTGASGTFTVPTLDSSDAGNEYLAEWVGVDGYAINDPDLIQAGIEVNSDGSGGEVITPWWEILPDTETDISSMTVNPGDSVAISLTATNTPCTTTAQPHEPGFYWTITVDDESQPDDNFATNECYGGAGDSAEWIVEAPQVMDKISTLAPFTAPIGVSNLSTSQTFTSLDELVIVNNNDEIVATPSPFDANGFTVAYGDTAPPAP